MHVITQSQFAALVKEAGPCVSIYLPMEAVQNEHGDVLRLRKALHESELQLRDLGCTKEESDDLLKGARNCATSDVWRSRGKYMAILLSHNVQLFMPLDLPLAEEVAADVCFHVRQLVPFIVDSDAFYVLALSEHHVQLYAGDSSKLVPLDVPGMPDCLEVALQRETPDRIQGATSTVATSTGRRATHYHGQGGRPDTDKSEKSEFVQCVAGAVDHYLNGRTDPLMLATTQTLESLWRDNSLYPHTLETTVAGCPDRSQAHELYNTAWPKVLEHFQAQPYIKYRQMCRAKGDAEVRMRLDEALPAAAIGRVQMLLINPTRPVYGCFDAQAGKVEVYRDILLGDCDLWESLIAETILHGGQIYPLPAETDSRAVNSSPSLVHALLRF